jgi:hypothetical protein
VPLFRVSWRLNIELLLDNTKITDMLGLSDCSCKKN